MVLIGLGAYGNVIASQCNANMGNWGDEGIAGIGIGNLLRWHAESVITLASYLFPVFIRPSHQNKVLVYHSFSSNMVMPANIDQSSEAAARPDDAPASNTTRLLKL